MKKILVLFFLLYGAMAFGQNTFKYEIHANGGVRIGGATNTKIDSVTTQGGKLRIMSGATLQEMYGHILVSDSATMLTKYARKTSPTFTGTPIAPTAPTGTNTTQIATTAFVQSVMDILLDSISKLREDITALENAVSDPPPAMYAADYYVATWGDDDATGTFTEPWLTWQKAVTTVVAGDTVYIRGGTYYYPGGVNGHGVYRENVNGTEANPIVIMNYPGENPIFEGSTITSTTDHRWGIYLYNCDYWIFKGLTIINVPQQDAAHTAEGFRFMLCNNITLERCIAHDIDGTGINALYANGFLIRNCDSYNNDDPYLNNNGNGIVISYTDSLSTNTVRACRAWDNTWGEGFGTWSAEGIIVLDSCWAWNNTGGAGDGYGFELAAGNHNQGVTVKRTITNCISANNEESGFILAGNLMAMNIYNNIAYSNDGGGIYPGTDANVRTFRNNLSFDNTDYQYATPDGDNDVVDHNSWQDGITVTSDDFVSLDMAQLDNARQSNGNLPVITTFTLVTGSDLKNAGVDVGIPYLGVAPDIGAFEFIE